MAAVGHHSSLLLPRQRPSSYDSAFPRRSLYSSVPELKDPRFISPSLLDRRGITKVKPEAPLPSQPPLMKADVRSTPENWRKQTLILNQRKACAAMVACGSQAATPLLSPEKLVSKPEVSQSLENVKSKPGGSEASNAAEEAEPLKGFKNLQNPSQFEMPGKASIATLREAGSKESAFMPEDALQSLEGVKSKPKDFSEGAGPLVKPPSRSLDQERSLKNSKADTVKEHNGGLMASKPNDFCKDKEPLMKPLIRPSDQGRSLRNSKANTVKEANGSLKASRTNVFRKDKEPLMKPLSRSSVQLRSSKNSKANSVKEANVSPVVINRGKSREKGVRETEEALQKLESLKCNQNASADLSGAKDADPLMALSSVFDKVCVIDTVSSAREVVGLLTNEYKEFVHVCDTEVSNIDVKKETPVGRGDIICFSIYSGPKADFGNGKSCIWVDVLDGGREVLMEFSPFFENPLIKKVWHNYSFDCHVIKNYGIKLSGFHADTVHLARLWDSSRRNQGGYSLEALTKCEKLMFPSKASSSSTFDAAVAKVSMKSIFGKKKISKNGTEGKLVTVPPVETLQRESPLLWICYSARDSISTYNLFHRLKEQLMVKEWVLNGKHAGNMYEFYEKYWRPFGELLVKMEWEGMLVDRLYLSEVEKVAKVEQKAAAESFRKWAAKYCPDAEYVNVGSDTQLRILFFGGTLNKMDDNEQLPESKTFRIPNKESFTEAGEKPSSKFRDITLHSLLEGLAEKLQPQLFTPSGWPSVSADSLKALAGKISRSYDLVGDALECKSNSSNHVDKSAYGTAYAAFGEGVKGKEACHAIAALCDVCSIDSLISNFILPLQGDDISCTNGRIHCSLNINTETGRLSARRPNLQNQPALEKDRYKIRKAFIAEPRKSLIVADYGQLELRILAHLANCKSMLAAFKAGGDFHSRTAMNMYEHIFDAVEKKRVLLEWHPQPGEENPPVPLLKDAFAAERRKAKMLNFSIAYGKTPMGLSRDWKVSLKEAKNTVDLWYKERKEVLEWQEARKQEAAEMRCVHTLLGRARHFPSMNKVSFAQRGHIERAAINTPVQGSAADVAMCAMLEIDRNHRLKELGWRLLLQIHDEVILEGPSDSAEVAKEIVVGCMSKPFYGSNFLKVDLSVDAKCAQSWYAAK